VAHTGAALKRRAARRGLLFGAAVMAADLAGDPAYRDLVLAQCAVVVPGLEAKWAATEPNAGQFTFDQLDRVAEFAGAHRLKLRLHNLVWGVYNPPWVAEAALTGQGDAILARHISTVAGRYRGQAIAWDVVNEPSDPRWNQPDDLANIVWKRALGPAYLDYAFARARQADPSAKLYLNDDLLEYDDTASEAKRAAYLRLIEAALRRGVPIQGFGLESHLRLDRRLGPVPYRQFLAELAAMGLELTLTELDVSDRTLPADPAARDAAIASHVKTLLDAALDEPAVRAVLCWGLTTRYSYLNKSPETRRPDGLPSRGLPYDAQFRPTPMWHAIAAAFDATAPR
jgi:endo-1,4-beta-xylanase